MRIEFEARVDVRRDRLRRVLLYVALTVCGYVLWIQRWRNEQAPRNRFRTRSGMGWTWGLRKPVDLNALPRARRSHAA